MPQLVRCTIRICTGTCHYRENITHKISRNPIIITDKGEREEYWLITITQETMSQHTNTICLHIASQHVRIWSRITPLNHDLPKCASQVIWMSKLEESHFSEFLNCLPSETTKVRIGIEELSIRRKNCLRDRVLEEHDMIIYRVANRFVADFSHCASCITLPWDALSRPTSVLRTFWRSSWTADSRYRIFLMVSVRTVTLFFRMDIPEDLTWLDRQTLPLKDRKVR